MSDGSGSPSSEAWPDAAAILTAIGDGFAGLARAFDHAGLDRATGCLAPVRRVICAGVGKSGHAAAKAAGTMNSLGVPAMTLNALDALHGDLGAVTVDDGVLLLSWSGETPELVAIAGHCRDLAAPTVAIAQAGRHALAGAVDARLALPPLPEVGPHGAPVLRTLLLLAGADLLALAIARRRGGVGHQKFRRTHPAGVLGRGPAY